MKALMGPAAFAACVILVRASSILLSDQTSPSLIQNVSPDLALIEFEPGTTKWVTDDEKWQLKREGVNFMDITATPDLGLNDARPFSQLPRTVLFPSHVKYNATIHHLLHSLDKENMRDHLITFTAFHTRYYKSSYGKQSAEWLFDQVNTTVAKSPASKHSATVRVFEHPWGQNSVIAQIPGRSNKTIVIGAHQDSINLLFPSFFAAPGADDDGSGTVTILEALRVLLLSDVANGTAENTVEFHWYSAEEGGLLGSQAVFSDYKKTGRQIRAMLHQDMTGYAAGTLNAGKPESMGVITDFTDANLTAFIKKLITEYCDIPYVLTKCGYACSDHASASKAGYPAAFVIESEFSDSDKRIHTTEDKIDVLSFDHMLQHAKLTLSLAYELAHATLDFE